ncbi:MAG: branched-chain amino acid ABC transporter substrate-binding protein [Bacillota bacterium]|jgi:branched-chain amino acid transport system substrate-binding protein
MKRSRLFAILVAAAVVVAAFATGCSSGESNTAEKKETVKLGFIGPITGADAAEGAAARNAFLMAVDAANDSGEYPYNIEVEVIDDAATASTGAAGAQQLVADPDIVAVSGHWNSPVAEATIPIFKQANIPLLIWGAIKDGLTSEENYPYITRSAPTAAQENQPLAEKTMGQGGLDYKKWFIVSDVSSYGEANTIEFTNKIKEFDGELVGTEKVQTGTVDFRSVISKIKTSDADAVYYGGVVTEASLLKNQLHEEGLDNLLFAGISGVCSEDFLKIGAEASEGALSVKPGVDPAKSSEGEVFLAAYAEKGYTEPVGAFTPYAYEAAVILLNALKECGDTPTAEAMVNAIKDSKTTGIMGTTTFDEIGQTENVAAYLLIVQDGEWVPYDDSEYAAGIRTLPGK